MLRMYTKFQAWLKSDEKGASAVEYGLLIGLIAVAIIAVVGLLGDNLSSLFTRVKDAIAGAGN